MLEHVVLLIEHRPIRPRMVVHEVLKPLVHSLDAETVMSLRALELQLGMYVNAGHAAHSA